MRLRQLLTFTFCFCCLSTVGTAAPLDPVSFNEKYSSDVPVSGRVLTGVALAGSSSLNFSFPKPSNDTDGLCLHTISQDGTYSSETFYLLNKSGDGKYVDVNYPSKYKDVLDNFPADKLALLATPGNCNSKKVDNVILTIRGEHTSSDEVTLFVSSGRSDVYLRMPTSSGKKQSLKCQRIEEGNRTAYDTLCKVSLEKLVTGINELSLVRRKSGRTLPPVKFQLLNNN